MPFIDFSVNGMDTDTMPQFFEVVIVAFLVLISVELLLIYREVLRLQFRDKATREDGGAQAGTGQTINVTVAGPQGTTSLGPTVAVAQDAAAAVVSHEAQDSIGPGGAIDTERQAAARRAEAPRPSSTNAFARMCPSCGMENSSYRSECFNCGARL